MTRLVFRFVIGGRFQDPLKLRLTTSARHACDTENYMLDARATLFDVRRGWLYANDVDELIAAEFCLGRLL